MRKAAVFAVGWILFCVAVSPAAYAAAEVPLGFTDQFLFPVEQPTAIAFTPDGRMLVASKPGQLFVAVNGALRSASALDLRSKICFNSERGLLGVAVDPAFASNNYIYLFYTFKKFTGCPVGNATVPVNRISRFVLPPSNVINPTSELVLVDNMLSLAGYHNAGDLNFGSDGMLYASVGDSGCGTGTYAQCTKPQDPRGLLGKILRIKPGGGAPGDNPFNGTGSMECRLAGVGQPGFKCREIYAWGLRNPFRFAMDPNVASRFYINDVGNDKWEEIDRGQWAANYGWADREGHCAFNSYTDCGAPPGGMTNPILDYAHTAGCASITGGAFVPNDSGWPSSYLGKYLFADYVCGKVFRLEPLGSAFDMTEIFTGLGTGSVAHMEFGPLEPRRALYYTTFANGGEVRRIAFTSDGRPVAAVSASPISGLAPLTVTFDGSGSADPEEQSLTFEWDFGDGATATTSTAVTTHTYTTNGTRTASLVVRDPGGLTSNPAMVSIIVGNDPPNPVIVSPASGATFSVAQTLTLSGSASDREDGTLPASALVWRVWLFHRDHRHPYFGPASGNGLTFPAPAPEDMNAATNSYLIVELTATDSRGISTMVSRNILPHKVDLTFNTIPAGRYVTVQGQIFYGPSTIVSWAAWPLAVAAPSPQGRYVFTNWSDLQPNQHTITTPSSNATYTARFVKAAVS